MASSFCSPRWAGGLGYLGSQRVVQRFMAVENEARIPLSRNVGTMWMLLVYLFALLLGLVALPALAEIGRLEEVLADPERVFLVASQVFFHPLVGGVLLCAVIAAVMSTADSQLLLASAVATDDLPMVRRYAYALGSRQRVWLGRAFLVAAGVLAAVLSIASEESVFALVSYAWGGMGAAFAPVTVMALYWRRFNAPGALAAMISGTVAATIWGYFDGGPGGVMDIQPAAPRLRNRRALRRRRGIGDKAAASVRRHALRRGSRRTQPDNRRCLNRPLHLRRVLHAQFITGIGGGNAGVCRPCAALKWPSPADAPVVARQVLLSPDGCRARNTARSATVFRWSRR